MKRFYFFLVIIALGLQSSVAQDKIIKTNGQVIFAKVREITNEVIYYNKFPFTTDSNLYSIFTKNVTLIEYENGNTFIIKQNFVKKEKKNIQDSIKYFNNIISYYFTDIVIYESFTIAYERILKNKYLSLKFPLSLGYGYYSDKEHEAKNIFYVGMLLNYFPTRQGLFKYYLGPEIRGGMVEKEFTYYNYINNYTLYNQKLQFLYMKILFNNGVVLSATNHFNISLNIAFGVKYFERTQRGFSPSFSFNTSFGYRF